MFAARAGPADRGRCGAFTGADIGHFEGSGALESTGWEAGKLRTTEAAPIGSSVEETQGGAAAATCGTGTCGTGTCGTGWKREILASAAAGQGQDGLRRGGRSVRNVDLSSLQR